MDKIDFLSAGESEDSAIRFTCGFLSKVFLDNLN